MSDAHPIRSHGPGLSVGARVIAVVVLVAIGAVSAWLQHDARGRSAEPRTEFTANNPPAGLPAALTTGQHLHWSNCTSPPAARTGYDCATMKAPSTTGNRTAGRSTSP